MKLILVLGDSLSCPRPWQGVNLPDIYPTLLQQELGGDFYVTNYATSENNSRVFPGRLGIRSRGEPGLRCDPTWHSRLRAPPNVTTRKNNHRRRRADPDYPPRVELLRAPQIEKPIRYN